MISVSSRMFSANPIHYLNLASKECVEIKRGKMVFQIVQKPPFENISPSGDPYWADPRNVAELEKRLTERREGKNPVVATLQGSEAIENYINSL